MKVIRVVSELVGVNESPISGDYITSSERSFTSRGVVASSSVLYNQTKGLSAIVDAVTDSKIEAVGTKFDPGDLWKVTLDSDWTVQNDDGLPLVEIQCKRCGFSYPAKTLIKGRCQTCNDAPQRG